MYEMFSFLVSSFAAHAIIFIVGYIAVKLSAKANPIKAMVKLQQIRSILKIRIFFPVFFLCLFFNLGPQKLNCTRTQNKEKHNYGLIGIWHSV